MEQFFSSTSSSRTVETGKFIFGTFKWVFLGGGEICSRRFIKRLRKENEYFCCCFCCKGNKERSKQKVIPCFYLRSLPARSLAILTRDSLDEAWNKMPRVNDVTGTLWRHRKVMTSSEGYVVIGILPKLNCKGVVYKWCQGLKGVRGQGFCDDSTKALGIKRGTRRQVGQKLFHNCVTSFMNDPKDWYLDWDPSYLVIKPNNSLLEYSNSLNK